MTISCWHGSSTFFSFHFLVSLVVSWAWVFQEPVEEEDSCPLHWISVRRSIDCDRLSRILVPDSDGRVETVDRKADPGNSTMDKWDDRPMAKVETMKKLSGHQNENKIELKKLDDAHRLSMIPCCCCWRDEKKIRPSWDDCCSISEEIDLANKATVKIMKMSAPFPLSFSSESHRRNNRLSFIVLFLDFFCLIVFEAVVSSRNALFEYRNKRDTAEWGMTGLSWKCTCDWKRIELLNLRVECNTVIRFCKRSLRD